MGARRFVRGLTAWMTAAIAACAVIASPATAATFTVNDAGDSGAGTLRQAILDANVDGTADLIDFALGGQTISPTSALPPITEPVTIDATTDPGNIIDGTNAGVATNGLTVNSANVTIKGLEIDDFTGDGILVNASNSAIGQNSIGVFGGNGGNGINIAAGTGAAIGGTVGANTIETNGGAGIAIAANSSVVVGNTIGDFGAGNSGDGITLSGSASNNQIGSDTNGNQIVESGGAGVAVTGTGTGNAIIGNAISGSGGLGIDLGTSGVTANDALDADTGANELQNFPALTDFTTSSGNSTITGTFNSTANTSFRISFYSMPQCDDSGNGEGDTYVGSATVSTDGSGNATINSTFPAINDHFVTATATRGTSGTGSTSEFSACVTGPPTGVVVTNGTVGLGINNTGDLNYSCTNVEQNCPGDSAGGAGPVGLRYVPSNLDSTSPGCPCEGWGMADVGSGLTGYANESAGTANVAVNSFTHTSTSAVSSVTITDSNIANASMTVVQDYHPSGASSNLYEDTVTVTNTGTVGFTDLRYRRAMDWDIEPTAFNEYSTIQGTSPQLLFDSDNGFASSDPLVPAGDLGSTGQFVDSGPADHGAVFDFGFGTLAQGASKTFKVYYGAAPNETAAVNALTAGGAQVYSLGESSCPESGNTVAGCDGLPANAGRDLGEPATFMFGFVTTTGDLSITKTDSPDPVIINHDLTYTLTITNNGPQAAAGVHVEDPLPAGVTYKSATPSTGGSCANVSGTVKCDFPSIANGASKTVTIVVTPTSTTSDLSNTATVTSASADANPANNSATSHTQVVADQPQISIDDPTSIPEGDSGTKNLTFTISIDKTSGSDVTVHYATSNGTATQPADYTSTSGTATITAGQTSTTVDVPIVGDTLDENDETLHVDLTSPTGALILDNQGTGTIIDDDGPPSASVGDTSVIEGTGGTTTMHVPVTLSAASGKTVTVDYATSAGTAATGTDYTTTTGTLTFNPGDTSKTIDVPIVTDSIDESDETFTVTLTNPSNTTIADSSGTETIIDDDTTTVPPVTPTLSIGDATVNPEGNSGTTNATFTVTLSSASLSVVTVNYATSNGTATAPGDYTAASGTLTFSPGDTSKTVTVAVVGDTVPEPDETFTVGLSTPSGATIADGSGLGTIVDDDQLGGGGSVGGGDLFCGVQHRGKCKGLPVKDEFDRPGNAVWVFAAYNPPPGKTRAHTAAARPIVLGQVRRKVAKGKVSFVFKLKPGKKTKQLYKRVKKAKLKGVLITRTFTPADGGAAERVTKSVKLKR
jgi:uncharacterized repeat protein (TIGR01451 family)